MNTNTLHPAAGSKPCIREGEATCFVSSLKTSSFKLYNKIILCIIKKIIFCREPAPVPQQINKRHSAATQRRKEFELKITGKPGGSTDAGRTRRRSKKRRRKEE